MVTARWMILSGLLVGAVALLAACGDDEDPVATGNGARLALAQCDDLEMALDPTVDGPLSDDPEVAAGQRNRANVGLPSDEAATRSAMADQDSTDLPPEASDLRSGFGPMTSEEALQVAERVERAEKTAEALGPMLGGRPEIGTNSIDNRTGQIVVRTAGNVAALQAELDEAIGSERVRVEATAAGHGELSDLQRRVGEHLVAAGIDFAGTGSGNALGRVTVDLAVLDPAVVDELAATFADQVDLLCVSGADPADVIPDGPQPQSGDGWRLLADEPGAGVAYDTGFATDTGAYKALWNEIGLAGEPPDVDFGTEVALWFGPAVSGSCSDIRMVDVVIDADNALVYPRIVLPGGHRSCTSDANPHAYVVAVQRELLPERFTVTVDAERQLACCPAASTDVDLGG